MRRRLLASCGLQRFASMLTLESVAGGNLSALEAAFEPRRAIARGAVRERVGIHAPSGHPLQSIVADRRGSVETIIHFARIEQIALLRRVSPHARVAVGLQLEAHRVV